MNVQASFNFYSEHIDSALPIITSGASYGDMIKQFAKFHPNLDEDSKFPLPSACLPRMHRYSDSNDAMINASAFQARGPRFESRWEHSSFSL